MNNLFNAIKLYQEEADKEQKEQEEQDENGEDTK